MTQAQGVRFETVLLDELAQIAAARERETKRGPAAGTEEQVDEPQGDLVKAERSVLRTGAPPAPDTAPELARAMKLRGLAFSGGGIRSATFNLGVLQALCEH